MTDCPEYMALRLKAIDAGQAGRTAEYIALVHAINAHCAECPKCDKQAAFNHLQRIAAERAAERETHTYPET